MATSLTSVLIIYTGGTIGMAQNPVTGALEPFNGWVDLFTAFDSFSGWIAPLPDSFDGFDSFDERSASSLSLLDSLSTPFASFDSFNAFFSSDSFHDCSIPSSLFSLTTGSAAELSVDSGSARSGDPVDRFPSFIAFFFFLFINFPFFSVSATPIPLLVSFDTPFVSTEAASFFNPFIRRSGETICGFEDRLAFGGSESDSKKRKNRAERNLHRTLAAVLQTHHSDELDLDVVRQLHEQVKRRISERFLRRLRARNHLKGVIGGVYSGKQHESASLRLGLLQWNLPKHFGLLQRGLIALEITTHSLHPSKRTFRIALRWGEETRAPGRRRKCRACGPIRRRFDRKDP